MPNRRSLAAAQTIPVRGEVEANVEQHLRLAKMAASRQAGILVFPELSLTGYELDLARQLAFNEEDRRLAPLVEAASEHSMILIVGAPVRIGERLHIGAFILSPDRGVDVYTKRRLGTFAASASVDGVVPPAEATVFHPGRRNPLVTFDGSTAALAVCADVGRASHARRAARRGATAYLASMFVIPSDYDRETGKLEAYAARYTMAVVMANFGGPSGRLDAAGRSAIWSDGGDRLARLEAAGAGVVVAVEGPGGWRAWTAEQGGSFFRTTKC